MKQIILTILLTLSIFAQEYKIGDTIEPINLKDQFSQEHNISKLPKIIVMAFEKESSYIFNEYMKKKNGDFLDKNKILFLADISQMPSFITTAFALPKMRKYNYNVLLIQSEALALKFPHKKQKLTILKLNDNVIKDIYFASDLDKLEKILE